VRKGVRSGHRGSLIITANRALISSYRLSIVTMTLTEVIWPQFGENRVLQGVKHWVAIGQLNFLVQTVYR